MMNIMTRIVQIAMWHQHALALTNEGQVIAWGLNKHGQCDVPIGLTNVVQVAVGDTHSLALTRDGRVVAWGNNFSKQCDVPAGLTNVVQIAACTHHSVAVTRDGQIVAWGRKREVGVIPNGIAPCVRISTGDSHSVAVTRDGQVVAWGMNTKNQCAIPAELSDVVQVAAGGFHSLALTDDGRVVAWGSPLSGQCSVPRGVTDVIQVSAGGFHSLALTRDGRVVAWGDNDEKQCTIPAGLPNVVQVVAGITGSLALTHDGQVVGWGELKEVGEIPEALVHELPQNPPTSEGLHHDDGMVPQIGAQTDITIPLSIPMVFDTTTEHTANHVNVIDVPPLMRDTTTRIVQIAMWRQHALALTNEGQVIAWGLNKHGQCNVPIGLTNVVQVAVGDTHSLALTRDGRVVAWGNNFSKQCDVPAGLANVVQISANEKYSVAVTRAGQISIWGDLSSKLEDTPHRIPECKQISAGDDHVLVLTRDGRVIAWGSNAKGQCNVPDGLNNVIQVSAGGLHSLALTDDGRVVAWGATIAGQCSVPRGVTDVIQVSAGGLHSLALTRDGRVIAWGGNDKKQCTVPVGLPNVVQVVAGITGSLALTHDGQLVGWGNKKIRNKVPEVKNAHQVVIGKQHVLVLANGVLIAQGDESESTWHVPLGIQDVIQIAAGGKYSLAVTSNNRVHVWPELHKYNMSGTQPSLNDIVIKVAAGSRHFLALTQDKRVRVWGETGFNCDIPEKLQQVDIKDIAAGDDYSLVLTSDGYVEAWGSNYWGQCNIPLGLADVVQVSAGATHALALTNKGRVIAWGQNYKSQCEVPSTLSNVKQVVAGKYHSLALTNQGQIVAWGENEHGQCDVPIWLHNTAIIQLVAGDSYSLALLQSGRIISWGGNDVLDGNGFIQIGTQSTLEYFHPYVAQDRYDMEFFGGEAYLYSTPSGLLKRYISSNQLRRAKLDYLMKTGITHMQNHRELIIWPKNLAFHPFTGELVGYVMEYVDSNGKLLDVIIPNNRKQKWPEHASDPVREWQFVLTVARWSAAVLAHIHAHSYVVGDLSPRNILVYDEGTVAFVDCDSYQVGDGSAYGCSVSTPGYRAPEVRKHTDGHWQYTVHSDAYALAVAIFRLLSGDVHPYQGITLPSATLTPDQHQQIAQYYPHLQPIPDGVDATAYCEARGIWPYDTTQRVCVPPVVMQAYYPQFPAAVRELFNRAFTGAPDKRPTPAEWVQVLDKWRKEVQ